MLKHALNSNSSSSSDSEVIEDSDISNEYSKLPSINENEDEF